ncbi:MAG: hypothetical protein ABJA67_02160 [Chthonomonadales bacterium]
MNQIRIDTRQIHSLTDFMRNYKVYIANLKKTRLPEVLTVNGKAELVIMDSQSYQAIVDRLDALEALRDTREIMARYQEDDPISKEEMDRRNRIVDELTAESEKLGLYR